MKGNLQKRGDSYQKKDKTAQKAHGVVRTFQMIFPGKAKPPLSARFALWILARHKARIVDALRDIKEGK